MHKKLLHVSGLFWFVVAWVISFSVHAMDIPQKVVVPEQVSFADVKIKLHPSVRIRIQNKVNYLIRPSKSLQVLLDRMNLLFPIIESILAEENVPQDFKYQALHESTLIGNALSSCKDVGYWQIQPLTALDLKLKIDDHVDERMHLIRSTRAAAQFLKGHQQYFKNWIGSMLAYNRGRIGAAKLFPKKYIGSKTMRLDSTTDDYIIYVLANKLAFQKLVGKNRHPTLNLYIYNQGHQGHTLANIANHLKIEEKLLRQHNFWIKRNIIPHDTSCSLIVPFLHTHAPTTRSSTLKLPAIQNKAIAPRKATTKSISVQNKPGLASNPINYDAYFSNATPPFPKLIVLHDTRSARLVKSNGILAIVAKKGDSMPSLAKLLNVNLKQFRLMNDITQDHSPVPGMVYYYGVKQNKAAVHYHIVQPDECPWTIAQKYGIKLSALLEKNRIIQGTAPALQVGKILWLRFIRPKNIPVAYKR